MAALPIITPSSEPSTATFPCPQCNAFLFGDATKCQYCSAEISPEHAYYAAKLQERINRACDEAGWLRALTGAMWVFFFVRLIPFVGYIGAGATFITFFSAPCWLIYWRVRFGGIETRDVDYKRANRNWTIGVVLWSIMAVVFFIQLVFYVVLILMRGAAP